jgi:hypothetical protein
MTSETHSVGMPPELDPHDTAPPPLPPWLKGFLVTSKNAADVKRAGEEVAKLCSDFWFKAAYDEQVPASMVGQPGVTAVPFDTAESLHVPGCKGTVFVALRPDNTTVDVRLLAKGLIEESDAVGGPDAKGEAWTKTAHTRRIIPIERIAPETDFDELAEKVISWHLPELPPEKRKDTLTTFRVHFEEHSPALHLKKLEIAKKIADLVPEDSYKVDLKHADLVILCVVAGGCAMMSVVEGYDDRMHHFTIHPEKQPASPPAA